jgi:hypothetical protein
MKEITKCLLSLQHDMLIEKWSTLTHQSDNVDKPLLATQKEKKDYVRERKVANKADRGKMESNQTKQV